MEVLLAILFVAVISAIYFLIEYWWIAVIVVAVVGGIALAILCAEDKKVKGVVKARVVEETPIIERVAENTGYTVGYGKHLTCHEHYRYRNVVTGYDVKFVVTFANGKEGIMTCKKDSAEYNILIKK